MSKLKEQKSIFFIFIFFLLMLSGCSEKEGRVSVILDNSGSMSSTGTSFTKIKQSVFNALLLIPRPYEKGLRVFDDRGSILVSPYHRSLNALQSRLSTIEPGGGTYIGQSLLDASEDLLKNPAGDNRLLLITDGEGNSGDIDAAKEVKNRLQGLQGEFKCNFILFSRRKDVLNETPIGRVSEILGCELTVPDDYVSAASLTTALQRIFGFDFYWLWIIISALLYIILLVLTAQLIFHTKYAQGVAPSHARSLAITFLFALLPLVMGAHIIGLFSWLAGFVWGFVILALSSLFLAVTRSGKKQNKGGNDEDPFA